MTSEGFDKTVRIPVRVVDGTLEFFYGGSLPQLRHGAIGELVISSDSVLDAGHLKKLQEQRIEELFPPETKLMAVIRESAVPEELNSAVLTLRHAFSSGGFVEIVLMQPLELRLRGTKPASLEDCQCYIPGLKKEAKSLNHAYSLISSAFEPRRKSNTGNVFNLVFWEDRSDGSWKPLRLLREKVEADFEQRFMEKR